MVGGVDGGVEALKADAGHTKVVARSHVSSRFDWKLELRVMTIEK